MWKKNKLKINTCSAVFLALCCGTNLHASYLPNSIIGNTSSDLVIGSIGYPNFQDEELAGAVNVLYSPINKPPLWTATYQLWYPGYNNLSGTHEGLDLYGNSLALGDFNNDGTADLAVGVPGKEVDGKISAGQVNIMRGSYSNGLTASLAQYFYQGFYISLNSKILGTPKENDMFGSIVVTGDFNGDNYDDLAVGVPNKDIVTYENGTLTTHLDAGQVQIIYGSENSLTTSGNEVWYQNDTIGSGDSEINDRFGSKLSSGDYNGDGYADLAIGSPDEDFLDRVDTGAVSILYGSATGLVGDSHQILMQNISSTIKNMFPLDNVFAEAYDKFGSALSSGDFNCDGYVDLAIGATGDTPGAISHAGSVVIVYGSRNGLDQNKSQLLLANYTESANDGFGFALASGDFDGNKCDDIAVGVPFYDFGSKADAGIVSINYGTRSGITDENSRYLTQFMFDGILERAGNNFGKVLSVGDFDADRYMDLVVGVPDETVGGKADAGVINYMFGSANGLDTTRSYVISKNDIGTDGASSGERFGFSLASMPPRKYEKNINITPVITYILNN